MTTGNGILHPQITSDASWLFHNNGDGRSPTFEIVGIAAHPGKLGVVATTSQ